LRGGDLADDNSFKLPIKEGSPGSVQDDADEQKQ
jgi:hypothetical protein